MKKSRARYLVFLLLLGFLAAAVALPADDRAQWQQPQKVMDVIGVKPGMVIGEVGVGKGFFTFRLARRVGEAGKVYANEIRRDHLDYIEKRCQERGIGNIVTVKGKVADPLFPENNLEMVIMVYVFHHLDEPVAFMQNLKKYLKPGAPVVIVEQDPQKTGSTTGHFYKKEKVLQLVRRSGYRLVRMETFLKKDNIFILEPGRRDEE